MLQHTLKTSHQSQHNWRTLPTSSDH